MKNIKKTTAFRKTMASCFTAILLLIGILTGIENTQPENPQDSTAVMLCGENPLNDNVDLE